MLSSNETNRSTDSAFIEPRLLGAHLVCRILIFPKHARFQDLLSIRVCRLISDLRHRWLCCDYEDILRSLAGAPFNHLLVEWVFC